ncbi:signal recognition particle protein [Clostridia bacterium OttesenSCG-928-F22]|nr:signal recognition particle protein [Clostridia bacterium OttesenSCG-928-F22]
MAFEGLSQKLQAVFKKLGNRGKLSEKDIKEAMREVKLALLEADVSFVIVKQFVKSVSDRAVGNEVMESLTPGQQVIKIVNEEMTKLMGSTGAKLTFSSQPPTIYMLLGLQGAGKTTMCGKLGGYLKKQGKDVMLAACDIYRPAAIKQLQVVGEKLSIPVFEMGQEKPLKIATEALKAASKAGSDVLILDTAGRLHIDEDMMEELKEIKEKLQPQELLLVVDAMTGQDAVNVAEIFNNALDIDGVIVTKLDGDTRGGAALSVKAVTGKPIKFSGIGEKLEDIEPFHPDRMASRILGMGDVLTLIEKAQTAFDEKQAAEMEKKIRTQQFTLDDFLDQLDQLNKMGNLGDMMGMIPGMGKMGNLQVDEKQTEKTKAIILSMTGAERNNPNIINGSRRKRIARGSGVTIQEVNRLLNQFEQVKKMMKQMTEGGRRARGRFKLPF